MASTSILAEALRMLASNPELVRKISMPNVPFPTLGGMFFWITIAESNGWRLQQNTITQHARILDANNVRVAWGGIDAMEGTMARFVRYGTPSR